MEAQIDIRRGTPGYWTRLLITLALMFFSLFSHFHPGFLAKL